MLFRGGQSSKETYSTKPAPPGTQRSAISTEVFEYVSHSTPTLAINADPQRKLELAHYPFLCEAIGLSMEDLSLYVLAYYFGCSGAMPFHIEEPKFVSGLSKALSNKDKPTAQNNYAPAFAALRSAVEQQNKLIRSSPKELEAFYNFLFRWCLKNNKASDRTDIAVELWQLFFFKEASATDNTEPCQRYVHYARFEHLQDWLDFTEKAEPFVEYSVSADLWQQLFLFASVPSYETHDPSDAWPIAIDEYVEWYNKRKKEQEPKAQ